jgi:hypothetical protein
MYLQWGARKYMLILPWHYLESILHCLLDKKKYLSELQRDIYQL